jgi:uncharacterized protein (TIGR03000 family)
MYSLVLMMAMTGGPEAPSFFLPCWGCNGCFGCFGGYGCYGCYGCHGWHHRACCGCNGYMTCYGAAPAKGKGGQTPEDVDEPKDKESSLAPAPATIVVTVPREARLIIGGRVIKSSTTTRRFTSPPLERGMRFAYPLRAEVIRDGDTVTVTRRVTVRAGDEVHVTLDLSESVAAR